VPRPNSEDPSALRPSGLLRRLAAIFYDTLLLLAVWFLATLILLPFTHGRAVEPHNPFYTLYLSLVAFLFFGWFWTHGGQTLGMRAWRLRVAQPDGSPITLWQAALRFAGALFSWGAVGLGFWWSLVDSRKRTWHDLLSGTILVVVRPMSSARERQNP
jgi:uncharacterized RDD family membrane protein YckC